MDNKDLTIGAQDLRNNLFFDDKAKEPGQDVAYWDNPGTDMANKDELTFDGVNHIDSDIDHWFTLRGDSINHLVDAATPLLGLVLRVKQLSHYDQVPQLYVRVRDEIAAIIAEVQTLGYSKSNQLAYRYSLCSFIDEAIMGTPWGAHSVWAERSMLSIYHDETWGGEKFYTILARTLTDPEKYHDLLEMIYLFMTLGFRGKYGVQFEGDAERQAIIKKLHHVLRQLRGETPDDLIDRSANVRASKYQLNDGFPLWGIWSIAGVVAIVAYSLYQYRLSLITDNVLKTLQTLLG